jgi:hypothetical protein
VAEGVTAKLRYYRMARADDGTVRCMYPESNGQDLRLIVLAWPEWPLERSEGRGHRRIRFAGRNRLGPLCKEMAPMAFPKLSSLATAALVAASLAAIDANGQQYPTALELAQLPKFCYAQYQVPNATGDEFRIRDCGPAMNHYCSGLMWIIRAKAATGNKNARMTMLGRAATDITYTENGMKDYPQCPLREHVAASKVQVLNLQKIYGGQPSAAK